MFPDTQTPAERPLRDVWSVTRLNREAKAIIEGSLPLLWLEGEISNLARPASGHLYFSLKDAHAQVRCAMFRMRNMHLRFKPANGMHVLARVRVSLYEARGEFQLIVEHMEEAGDGALRRAFEALKQRLAAEGLFAAERKRPLPAFSRCIGVVTSPTGAAIRDVLSVLRRRFPGLPVVIYPTAVQGEAAPRQIAAAIGRAGARGDCDVLVVARGGGSLEDLWAFNDEAVARAIHASPIPVVSAVGHEIDFTIADFVADVRAPTPSAAAELLSPDREQWAARLERRERRLRQCLESTLRRRRERLDSLARRLKHPGQRLEEIGQRVDELEQRLINAQRVILRHQRSRCGELQARLQRHTPLHRVEQLEARRAQLEFRLLTARNGHHERLRQRLATSVRALETVSPLATLSRGYAIVQTADESVLRRYDQVAPGDPVTARLGAGRIICRVEETHADD